MPSTPSPDRGCPLRPRTETPTDYERHRGHAAGTGGMERSRQQTRPGSLAWAFVVARVTESNPRSELGNHGAFGADHAADQRKRVLEAGWCAAAAPVFDRCLPLYLVRAVLRPEATGEAVAEVWRAGRAVDCGRSGQCRLQEAQIHL